MGLNTYLLLLLGTVSLLDAACPLVPPITNFDPDRFGGLWYQVEWLNTGPASAFQAQTRSCMTVDYTHTGNGSFTAVVNWNTEIGPLLIPFSSNQYLTPADPNFPNYFFTGVNGLMSREPNVFILDTDYTRHAILYTCTDLVFGIQEYGWIIHRRKIGFTDRRRTKILGELSSKLGITFVDPGQFNFVGQKCSGLGNFSTPTP
ncbi:apolipoprotein D-like [Pecten maximus]|uniref:apolipoprotein D-like n=1 Tax=Pecten maximus TaxID=6579 RepID=UPI00145868C6|nr:apolipoprotein D-like [Pecten maximus]